MYPYGFTYIKRSEPGPETVEDDFETTHFPPSQRGIDKMTCSASHPIDILESMPPRPQALCIELVAEKEEYELLDNTVALPPPLEELFGYQEASSHSY